ncbi:hypothetical protein BU16DRAFT_554951 [Lophium mytilinum]|uniref:Uncharacterized protein n=1 Tax=Lophium mytilinum TaxID=390894 RepID=A0A6A6REP5_9PEZI|nr:hypothetical protein BU16DRAFT_554951 [Lophium mytilinum]
MSVSTITTTATVTQTVTGERPSGGYPNPAFPIVALICLSLLFIFMTVFLILMIYTTYRDGTCQKCKNQSNRDPGGRRAWSSHPFAAATTAGVRSLQSMESLHSAASLSTFGSSFDQTNTGTPFALVVRKVSTGLVGTL